MWVWVRVWVRVRVRGEGENEGYLRQETARAVKREGVARCLARPADAELCKVGLGARQPLEAQATCTAPLGHRRGDLVEDLASKLSKYEYEYLLTYLPNSDRVRVRGDLIEDLAPIKVGGHRAHGVRDSRAGGVGGGIGGGLRAGRCRRRDLGVRVVPLLEQHPLCLLAARAVRLAQAMEGLEDRARSPRRLTVDAINRYRRLEVAEGTETLLQLGLGLGSGSGSGSG